MNSSCETEQNPAATDVKYTQWYEAGPADKMEEEHQEKSLSDGGRNQSTPPPKKAEPAKHCGRRQSSRLAGTAAVAPAKAASLSLLSVIVDSATMRAHAHQHQRDASLRRIKSR